MGINDAAEQLEAAQAECVRLEQALGSYAELDTLLNSLEHHGGDDDVVWMEFDRTTRRWHINGFSARGDI